MPDQPDLAALMGSRICHDLVSPLGAIGNGVELLMLDGGAARPEIALIAASVASANARLRFLRVAFGVVGGSQPMAPAEVTRLLDDCHRDSRLVVEWQVATPQERRLVRRAFLGLMCVTAALPLGGQVALMVDDGGGRLRATGPRLAVDSALWALLDQARADYPLAPPQVQFGLLRADLLAGPGLARVMVTDGAIELDWGPDRGPDRGR